MKTGTYVFIAQFLPLLFFYLFFAYPDEMLKISVSPLGRFVAIMIIIFYTNLHMMYGLVICILVILYYQMDLVEGMNDYSSKPSYNQVYPTIRKINHGKDEGWDIFDWILPHHNDHNDHHDHHDQHDHHDHHLTEGFTTDQDKFRQQNCQNSQLIYKNNPVKNENTEFIFPEIQFKNGVCNACDPNCDFSIVQKKISVQEDLTYPKVSDDWTTNIWKTWFSEDHSKPYASVGVISENFSLI